MSTLWCCPFSISSADHGTAHPPKCREGRFWRGCCGVWHARTMQAPDTCLRTLKSTHPTKIHNPLPSLSLATQACLHSSSHPTFAVQAISSQFSMWAGTGDVAIPSIQTQFCTAPIVLSTLVATCKSNTSQVAVISQKKNASRESQANCKTHRNL